MLFAENSLEFYRRAARWNDWKATFENGGVQIVDLLRDPAEMSPGAPADRVAEAERAAADFEHECARARAAVERAGAGEPLAPVVPPDEATLRRLPRWATSTDPAAGRRCAGSARSATSPVRRIRAMPTFDRDELEQAFRTYWRTGAVGEDWDAWADLFTEDCTYFEHYYGAMQGREVVRAWIKPVMARYGEIYTAYEWHTIDVERGRVIFYMQNRRDHPGGQGTIDFPGVSLLEYAGSGKWKREEDFWAWKQREVAMKAYEDASRQFDPEHARKKTRWSWGNGPEWTRGGRSWAERPRDR